MGSHQHLQELVGLPMGSVQPTKRTYGFCTGREGVGVSYAPAPARLRHALVIACGTRPGARQATPPFAPPGRPIPAGVLHNFSPLFCDNHQKELLQ